MKLTSAVIDLGRAVAYYPNLKNITGSTTATILLCQFLYWSPKSQGRDGWIWKTSEEIEEETGLTYNEQVTARKILVEKGFIIEQYKRLDHYMRFRVNEEKINEAWEAYTGVQSDESTPEEPELDSLAKEMLENEKNKKGVVASDIPVKRGDILDAVLDSEASPGMKKLRVQTEIRKKIQKELNINAEGKRWNDFIDFVYVRQENHGEIVETFLRWSLENGFNAVYWTPEKMRTVWPQAFMKSESGTYREDFVRPIETREEEKVFVPMPKNIGRKQNYQE
jgi:hypothetical protein